MITMSRTDNLIFSKLVPYAKEEKWRDVSVLMMGLLANSNAFGSLINGAQCLVRDKTSIVELLEWSNRQAARKNVASWDMLNKKSFYLLLLLSLDFEQPVTLRDTHNQVLNHAYRLISHDAYLPNLDCLLAVNLALFYLCEQIDLFIQKYSKFKSQNAASLISSEVGSIARRLITILNKTDKLYKLGNASVEHDLINLLTQVSQSVHQIALNHRNSLLQNHDHELGILIDAFKNLQLKLSKTVARAIQGSKKSGFLWLGERLEGIENTLSNIHGSEWSINRQKFVGVVASYWEFPDIYLSPDELSSLEDYLRVVVFLKESLEKASSENQERLGNCLLAVPIMRIQQTV